MMKALRTIGAVIVVIIMVPVVLVGMLLTVVRFEVQPENLANLTADIVSETLAKDNLKKITVADVSEYLPAEMTTGLSADATMEEVVPLAFNSVTGIESYVSLEAVEQMIEDDVVRDLTMAVLNEEDYDLVGLVDKYGIQIEPEWREQLAELKTSTIKQELAGQGYDVDEIVSGRLGVETTVEPEGTGEVATTATTKEQDFWLRWLNVFKPGVVIAMLVVFYLLLSLIWWDLKAGLVYWGAGMLLVGVILLTFNAIKIELVELGLGFAGVKMNLALVIPAIERLARPVLVAGIVSLVAGIGAIVGGKIWRAKTSAKEEPKNSKKQPVKAKGKK